MWAEFSLLPRSGERGYIAIYWGGAEMGRRGEVVMGRRVWLLATLLALGGSFLLAQEPAAKTVQLTIDYGDGSQKTFTAIEWKEKQTVFDVLQAAEKHPRGIKLK